MKKKGICTIPNPPRKNNHGEIKQKDDIKKAIDYLDWHFESDDGCADKGAKNAWYIIKNILTNGIWQFEKMTICSGGIGRHGECAGK